MVAHLNAALCARWRPLRSRAVHAPVPLAGERGRDGHPFSRQGAPPMHCARPRLGCPHRALYAGSGTGVCPALSGACPQRLVCDAHSSPATKSCGVAMTGWTSSVSTNRPPPAPPLAEGSDKRRTGGAAVSLEWRREPPFAGGRGGPTAKNLDRIPLGGAWYRARAPVRCTREVCHHSKVFARPARAPTSQGVPGSFRSAVGGARHFDG